MNTKIENLILKFLTKEANLDELRQLEIWINNPENETLFFEYIKTNTFINITMSKYDIKSAKANILHRIKQKEGTPKRSKVNHMLGYAAAAIVIGVLATIYISKDKSPNTPIDTPPVIVKSNIEAGTSKATLTLGDGSKVTLEKDKVYKADNVKSNGKELIYNTDNIKKSEIVYNYLTIPRGGEYFIKLSDGTEVWLNSESQLKYPIAFIEGETRQVELVYGEAYFEVSPSSDHNGSKFKVYNQNQEVEVFGTEFNIKAYKDEDIIYTTLVEGKIAVSNAITKLNLLPSQQSRVNLTNSDIDVSVVDVYSETAWKKGFFSFKSLALEKIMVVLSRWYDVDVIFENEKLKKVKFNGVLRKNDNIEEILTTIKNTNFINAYEITDKKITIE